MIPFSSLNPPMNQEIFGYSCPLSQVPGCPVSIQETWNQAAEMASTLSRSTDSMDQSFMNTRRYVYICGNR